MANEAKHLTDFEPTAYPAVVLTPGAAQRIEAAYDAACEQHFRARQYTPLANTIGEDCL